MNTVTNSGKLITRNYTGFKGVDFSNRKDEISIYRSPDALNVWKNYKSSFGKCIETRPDVVLKKSFDNTIFGLFFYTINTIKHMIVHVGTSLYDINTDTNESVCIKETGMKPAKSQAVILNNILFIKDGLNYLEYDGVTLSNVIDNATVPITYINCIPAGGGKPYQDHNLLSPSEINMFVGDGTSKNYFLNDQDINSVDSVYVDGVLKTINVDYTVNYALGRVTFMIAPDEPLTTGQDNVSIQYTKNTQMDRNRILKCNLMTIFDDRLFFSGNIDYPNYIFHSEFNGESGVADARYISDTDYYMEGTDASKVKAMISGNNALWVFKEPNQTDTSIFYHIPNDIYNENLSENQRAYPSTHSSISTGCVGNAINFMDDIAFFSPRGMEILATTNVEVEQVIAHASSFVDSRLLNEVNYKNMILQEWEGYLLVIIDNHVYLADSRSEIKYEWYYWELDMNITSTCVNDSTLYLCGNNKIYTLTNNEPSINSYWTTIEDEFTYPQYVKTTNKKGCVIDAIGNINVYVKTNKSEFALIKEYINTNGYVVSKIKKKKWKSIQLKIQSNQKFNLYSLTLESYVGGYMKR